MKGPVAEKLIARVIPLCLMFLLLSVSEAQGVEAIRATRLRAFAGLGFEYQDDTREDQRSDVTIEDEDRALFEELGFRLDGFLYHPRLLDFTVESELVYKQETEDTNQGRSIDTDEDFISYNISMRWLKEHPVSLTTQFYQNSNEIDSSFIEGSKVTAKESTVGLRYRNRLFPTIIQYSKSTLKGEGLNETDDETDRYIAEINNRGILGNSRLHYEHRDRTERGVLFLDDKRDIVRFNNSFGFGSKDRNTLLSGYTYDNQDGTIPFRSVTWNEDLFLEHTDNFNTFANFYFNDSDAQVQSVTTYSYRAGLNHSLYESLMTRFEAGVENVDLDQGDDDLLWTDLRFNYRKIIPFGTLGLNYGLRLENQDDDRSGTLGRRLFEDHTFGENPADDRTIILDEDLVFTESIEFVESDGSPLKDPDGDILTEGVHYSVQAVGTRTQIRLLTPDGLFLVGQDVLVNYTFEPRPPIEFNTTAQRWGITMNIKDTMRFFYSGGKSNQSLQEGVDVNNVLDDVTDRLYGAEITWKNTRSYGEKNVHHSDRSPFERKYYSENVLFPLGRAAILNFEGVYIDTKTWAGENLEEEQREIRRRFLGGVLFRLPRGAACRVEGIIGNEDQIAEDVDSVEYNFELTWSYGKFDFNLSYAYVDLDKDVTGDETHEDFFLLVRRYFGR